MEKNNQQLTVRARLEALPTSSYCSYLWSGAAVGPGGEVMPCCRFFGPRTKKDSPPHIRDGIKQAREGEYFTGLRKQMIEGKKPYQCGKCWGMEKDLLNAEDAGDKLVRGSLPRLNIDEKTDKTRQTTIGPAKIKYLETGISSLCNMACIMCSPSASSTIFSIKYPKMKISKGFQESNDNIDDDLSELRYLKFVGGEPMLEHKHDDLLEKVIQLNDTPERLAIEYHTNISHFPSRRVIECWKKIKKIIIIFSLDGVKENATLQRPGKYNWQMIEDTVNKYRELTNEVNIEFSSNTVMTALNVGQITDLIDWLYAKVGDKQIDWFNVNPITKMQQFEYIDFRNLSKETKNRIKKKWDDWEQSNPLVKSSPMGRMLDVARFHINEAGDLDKHLTKKLMLEKHFLSQNWKHFGEDLANLDIEEK
jgi:molybdenum cofactor biosynthesis enzyme MoaA